MGTRYTCKHGKFKRDDGIDVYVRPGGATKLWRPTPEEVEIAVINDEWPIFRVCSRMIVAQSGLNT